jgi:hypothetical protein
MAKQSRFRDHRDDGEHRQPGGRHGEGHQFRRYRYRCAYMTCGSTSAAVSPVVPAGLPLLVDWPGRIN